MGVTFRGELRCSACARYLGEFASHPEEHGRADVHVLQREAGPLSQYAVAIAGGLRCSRCGGRVVVEYVERAAA